MTLYAAVCTKEFQYRYKSPEVGEGQSPMPEDFEPIPPQVTPAAAGVKAMCDACGGDLRFVKLADPSMLEKPLAVPQTNGQPGMGAGAGPTRRINVAPPPMQVIFSAEAGEDVKDIRDIAGGRLLVITSKRILTVDPNVLGGE